MLRPISFQGGGVVIYNLPGVIFPLNTFILLQKIISIKYGSKGDKFFYFVGKVQGKTLMKQYTRQLKRKNLGAFKYCLSRLETFGIGKLNIRVFDSKNRHIIIQDENSPLSVQYQKLFGVQNQPVDYFLQGMCAGIAEALFGCAMQASENVCIAQGKKHCIIEIKENNRQKDFECKCIDWGEFLKSKIDDHSPKRTTAVVQKIFGLDQISIKKGVFRVWGVPGIVFPMDSIVLLYHVLLEYFGNDINHIFYILGKTQVMGAIDIQKKLFGLKKGLDILKNIAQQAELIGMGNLTVIDYDVKKMHLVIKNTNSQFCERYAKLFGNRKNSQNYFLTGCLAGLGQSLFGRSAVSIETKCVAQKDPFCLIEIKDRNEWDMKDSFIKRQFPEDVISQDMLRKHTTVASYLAPR